MDEPTNDVRELPELRALLDKYGPATVLTSIGDACADAARGKGDDGELWECAASAAREAADALDDDDDDESEDEETEADETEGEPPAPATATESTETEVSPPSREHEALDDDEPRKRTRMAREDQLGPRPPMATHWRCRRIEEDGKKTTLLFHDDGCGIAICEWPIKICGPETIRERWGRIGGAFVVQFIHSDPNGQRRPCGRSRVLHLTPPPPPPKQDATAPLSIAPFAPQHGGSGDDSFKQMLSLLAYMQDRDEKMRASAREEARIAIERLRADNELQMERERIASKERLAQLEVSARSAGRGIAAPGFDADLLAQRIGDAVGAKLEEVYADDDDEPQAIASNAPAPQPDALAKILEILQPLAQAAGPLLAQRLFEGSPPGVVNPSPPLRVIDGGNNGSQ